MLRPIKKVSKETPLVGRVINSFVSDNTEENAPSIQAVIDNMTPPQSLTVNGDLKINQRGKSEYTVNGYTLDMWEAYKSNSTAISVKKVDNGVELYADKILGFRQRNAYTNGIGKPITICCGLDGTDYAFTNNLTQEPKSFPLIENVNLSMEYTASNNIEYGIWLKDGKKHTVNYLKIYDGSIKYKNQKEDKATAFMRCSSKIFRGRLYALPYAHKGGTQYYFRGVTNYPNLMFNNPVIQYNAIDLPNVGNLQPSDISGIAVSNIYVGGTMIVDIGTTISLGSDFIKFPLIIDFTVSCEPLQ